MNGTWMKWGNETCRYLGEWFSRPREEKVKRGYGTSILDVLKKGQVQCGWSEGEKPGSRIPQALTGQGKNLGLCAQYEER